MTLMGRAPVPLLVAVAATCAICWAILEAAERIGRAMWTPR